MTARNRRASIGVGENRLDAVFFFEAGDRLRGGGQRNRDMKRVDFERKLWLLRHAILERDRRIAERDRRKERKLREQLGEVPRHVPKEMRTSSGRVWRRLVAPEIFSLTQNYEEVVALIDQIRQQALVKRESVYVDMKRIQHISPAATLLLTAELDRWRRIKKVKLRPRDLFEMQPHVVYTLAEMGFFGILQALRLPRMEYVVGEPRPIQFCAGNQSDLEAASELSRRVLEVAQGSLDEQNVMLLNDAIAEAMTNSVQHAYPAEAAAIYPVLHGEWWATGSYNPRNHQLTVWVYDQGVGIPATLPRSQLWERIRGRLTGVPVVGELVSDDAQLIEAAVEEGRTSVVPEHGRGLGLAEMAMLIKAHGRGYLRIISGRGEFRLWGEDRPNERINHDRPLGGTLVQISLTLS